MGVFKKDAPKGTDGHPDWPYILETRIVHGLEIKVKVYLSQADKYIKKMMELGEAAPCQKFNNRNN